MAISKKLRKEREELRQLGAEILNPQTPLGKIYEFQDRLRAYALATGQMLNKPAVNLLTESFARSVVAGDFEACDWVRLSCERFLEELGQQDSDYFPFIFDEELATKKLNRMQKFNPEIILQPCQHFILGNLFGWVDKQGGYRFRENYIHIPRKWGKSTFAASICTEEILSLRGQTSKDIYLLSGSGRQSKELEAKIHDLLNHNRGLASILEPKNGRIQRKDNKNCFIESLTSSASTKEGMALDVLIVDEGHILLNKHWDTVNTMIQGGLSGKKSPFFISISTAGSSTATIYKAKIDTYADYLTHRPPLKEQNNEEITRFLFLTTLDDPKNSASVFDWYKVQQNLPLINVKEYVLNFLSAKAEGGKRYSEFIIKNFNVFVECSDLLATEKSLSRNISADITRNRGTRAKAYLGVDLGGRSDFASFCVCVPVIGPNGRGCIALDYVHFLTTKSFNRLKGQKGKENLAKWVDEGKIILFEGESVDFCTLENVLRNFLSLYNIQKICYDSCGKAMFDYILERLGIKHLGQFINQEPRNLSPAVTWVKELTDSGCFIHDGSGIFEFFFSQAMLVDDKKGFTTLEKRNTTTSKIDLCDAVVNASKIMIEAGVKNTFDDIDNQLEQKAKRINKKKGSKNSPNFSN